jgi:hypothetical protein
LIKDVNITYLKQKWETLTNSIPATSYEFDPEGAQPEAVDEALPSLDTKTSLLKG